MAMRGRPFARRKDFFDSAAGRLAQYRHRRSQRLAFHLDEIEPRSKTAMSGADKIALQKAVHQQLVSSRRLAFRGPLALRLSLQTTDNNPGHAHTIAKNLLDLLGAPVSGAGIRRQGLLYYDDPQVHALSVVCMHGQDSPEIAITAMPLGSMLLDLALAERASYELDMAGREEWNSPYDAIDELKTLLKDEQAYRRSAGDSLFEAMTANFRRLAQEQFLGHARLSVRNLAHLSGAVPDPYGLGMSQQWNDIFHANPLRISLSALPQIDGASTQYKAEITRKLEEFRTKFAWLVDPLVVPVALDVVVQPPPPERRRGLHDLDNIVRDYLIPRVVETFHPVSHHSFLIDFEELERRDPGLRAMWGSKPTPPKSTRSGVTRYEAWRLPPATDSDGFVSVAVTADQLLPEDVFERIDETIQQWAEIVDRE
jgi:hypothetical protein